MTTLVVAGLPRSGSSLTMRMLASAGVQTVGSMPDFEDELTLPGRLTRGWLEAQSGHAVKILDPEFHEPGIFVGADLVVILLTRDPYQQALSQWKMSKHFGIAGVPTTRGERRHYVNKLRKDALAAAALFRRSRCPTIQMDFADLVMRPDWAARHLAEFLKPLVALDPELLAAPVYPRTPRCLDGMLEELIALEPVRREIGGV